MDAVKYFETKARMTNNCNIFCDECGLSIDNNDKNVPCSVFEINYPEEAVAIVEKWYQEHQEKTCAQVFFSRFPDAPRDENNGKSPRLCPDDCFKEAKRLCEYQCVECWDQKAPDEYQEWSINND